MQKNWRNFIYSFYHISVVWPCMEWALNVLQYLLLTCPGLTNTVWCRTILINMNILHAHHIKKLLVWNTQYPKYTMFCNGFLYGSGIAKNYRVRVRPCSPATICLSIQTITLLVATWVTSFEFWQWWNVPIWLMVCHTGVGRPPPHLPLPNPALATTSHPPTSMAPTGSTRFAHLSMWMCQR